MTRLAIVDYDKCKPNKCNKECMRYCPQNQQGVKCIQIVDIEDLGKKSTISAELCIGCGFCVKKCPFNAVRIVNLPQELSKSLTLYSYGENSFRVYSVPSVKKGVCIGLLGSNGLGKSTILKILNREITLDLEGNPDLKRMISGNEIYKYLTTSDLTVAYKPQDVLKTARRKFPVSRILPNIKQEYVERFKLNKLADRTLRDLSGGEMQRLMLAKVCSLDRDAYLFDEPAAFLDIRQRIKAAHLITEMKQETKYVVCVEHDLCVLDYICDYVTCLYGETSCYGVITPSKSTFKGINSYLEGYFRNENIRFRENPIRLTMNGLGNEDTDLGAVDEHPEMTYPENTIQYGDQFTLQIEPGSFRTCQVVLLIGENGTGKSSFVNWASGPDFTGLSVSTKPQDPYIEGFDGTVQQLLEYKCNSALGDSTFVSSVLKQLRITNIYEQDISSLSGGQMQKLAIAICLGTPADIYFLDEPSAYIDIDDRLHVAKIIRNFATRNSKTVFMVEHDIIMVTSISDQVIVFEGEPGVSCVAKSPQNLSTGINQFLESIGVTMRKDRLSSRPRINKFGSSRDKDQKLSGQYFLIE